MALPVVDAAASVLVLSWGVSKVTSTVGSAEVPLFGRRKMGRRQELAMERRRAHPSIAEWRVFCLTS